jgi:hypothetical protein
MRTRIFLICGLLLAVMATGLWAEGNTEGNALKITADYIWRNSPTPPKDNRIVDYYNANIAKKTGVVATWQNSALTGKTGQQLIQEWVAAGTTPEVIQYAALIQESTWSTPMVENKLMRTWTADDIKKYLPLYTARLAKYGVKVEDVLAFNKFKDQNFYIPIGFGYAQMPGLKDLPEAKTAGQNYYSVGLKDDVLKKIFPAAKSAAELQAVFAKNGKLTPQEITGDIPMKNTEDLYQYLKKVKALNLRVGDKPVIAAALSSQSESLGSIDWSLRTIIGYHWQWPIIFQNEPTFVGSNFLRNSKDYGDYLRWWNKLYNEGLLDPEIFVMKNDQYFAKIINGEYAVVNFWGPINDAIKKGKDSGYGYRFFPLFYGGIKNIYNNNVGYISLQASPLVITTKVKDADLAKVMKWVDWYMSEEHDQLAFWGTPDMYTGTGKDRRYKAEYKGVEEWAVYGQQSEKDGKYFGLQHAYPMVTNEYETVKLPLGGMSFFGLGFTYPESPYFVYPKDVAKIAALTDLWKYSHDTMYKTVWDDYKMWTYANWPNNEIRNLPAMAGWDQYQTDHSAEFSATVVKMVTGPVADFDKNWANYQRLWAEAGTADLEKQAATWMADYYKNVVLPKQIKK